MTGGTMSSLTPCCGTCGVEVPDPQHLRKTRIAGRVRRVCPPCAARAFRAGRGRRSVVYLVVMVVPWLLLAAIDPAITMTRAVLTALLVVGALALHVVVHEAAHSLVGLAVGMGVPEVTLGNGPTVLRLRVGSTTVKVGGFHSGMTHLEPRSTRWLRTRLAVSYAAGPLSNLALAAAALWLVDPPRGAAAAFTRLVVEAGVFVGVLNLAPLKVSAGGGVVRTDGAALLSLLRVGRDAGDQILAASRLGAVHRRHLAGETVEASADEHPVGSSDPVVLGIEGTRRIFTGEYDEAIALLREAASMPHQDGVRAITLNNLAWALLLAQPDGWLDEADRASAEALSHTPWMEAMMGTRGCVLVRRGDLDEGRRLIQRAVNGEAGRSELVVLYRHLFLAEHGLGNLYGARAALLALVDHGAGPEDVESARAALQTWEVDNALANLVGADGSIRWSDTHDAGVEVRHEEEMRRAVTAFVEDPSDDPRREALRRALDGQVS